MGCWFFCCLLGTDIYDLRMAHSDGFLISLPPSCSLGCTPHVCVRHAFRLPFESRWEGDEVTRDHGIGVDPLLWTVWTLDRRFDSPWRDFSPTPWVFSTSRSGSLSSRRSSKTQIFPTGAHSNPLAHSRYVSALRGGGRGLQTTITVTLLLPPLTFPELLRNKPSTGYSFYRVDRSHNQNSDE